MKGDTQRDGTLAHAPQHHPRQPGPPLCGFLRPASGPEGEALARKTAPLLEPVEHLYRSPMLRCRQTAELLWPGVETTVIDDLRETDFGPLEGMDNSRAKQTELYRRWTRGEIGPGEAVEDSRPRAVRAIRTIGRDAAE